MTIDVNALTATRPELRTAEVPVLDLAGLPGVDDEKPIWKVRMLTGEELDRSAETGEKGEAIAALAEKLAGSADAKADGVLSALGLSGNDTPNETRRAYDFLAAGSVEPAISRQDAIWLYKYFPIVAKTLARKIIELTGLGADMGKLRRSGKTRKSERASPSDKSTGAASMN